MRDLIISSLLLLPKLYFQPTRFRRELEEMFPISDVNQSGVEQWRTYWDSIAWRNLLRFLLQTLVNYFAVLALLVASLLIGFEVNWRDARDIWLSTLSLGFVISAFSLWSREGVFGSRFEQVLSLVVGLVLGLVLGLVVSPFFLWSRGLMLSLGIGLTFSLGLSLIVSLTVSLVVGLSFGLAMGLGEGWMFIVVYSLTFIAVYLHGLAFIFEALLSLWLNVAIRANPSRSSNRWQLSPVHWDEIILLPLPGLLGTLKIMLRTNPALGRQAVADVAAHRYQGRLALQALAEVSLENAQSIESLPALAALESELDWLTEDIELPTDTRSLLSQLRTIGQEVTAAHESTTLANRIRRLEEADRLLERLRVGRSPYRLPLEKWSQLLKAALEIAVQEKKQGGRIPQVYIYNDPLNPSKFKESNLLFKGRRSIFSQLEEILGTPGREPGTLFLYGQRRMGKTSVLLQMPRLLGSTAVPAFLDMQSGSLGGAKDTAGLLRGIADGIIEQAFRHRGLKLPDIDRKGLAYDPYPVFERWLRHVGKALEDRNLLITLDEFEELERGIHDERFDERILTTLRNIMQHHHNIIVLFSGSHKLDELPPRWASSLITSAMLPITFLHEQNARELIERPVADFPEIYMPAAVDHILELTHCQPNLVQLTCALLVGRMNHLRRKPPTSYIQVEDVDEIIPEVLERGSNYFIDLWQSQTESETARHILEKMVQTPDQSLDRHTLQSFVRSEDELRQALRVLERREIIHRKNDHYCITIPLVAEYIRREILY
jgi:uncharacterized protein